MKKFLIIICGLFLFIALSLQPANAAGETVQFFWAEGCPHCYTQSKFLDELQKKDKDLVVHKYEISKNRKNQQLLVEIGKKLKFDTSGVPITVIGENYIVGYTEGITDRQILKLLSGQSEKKDNVGEVCEIDKDDCDENRLNQKINLPLFGQIETKNFSLPALSVIIGAIDGFNPCAMWVLLFLITMLLGMKDRKKMWLLGLAFIITSAVVYFFFMVAWLNLLLFIGFIAAVRIIIGLVALGGGIYSLKDFFTNKDAACKVTGGQKRKKIYEKIKAVIHERSLLLALGGIVALAFAINLVELICSAGLPAVYTQILTMSNLPTWQYYMYIGIYIFFFMLDDLLVFFVAMMTLQITGITTKYTRFSRLIGGVIMAAIGVILIFKPAWLMFG
jgi:thiol-disulfide isomerase/thioredoxin